jgi:trigger factor
MNVTRKDIDANNAVLTVNIEKNDYAEKVEKQLRDYRKKANLPGFRPGMVPVGLLKKMYGKAIMGEQINELLSDALYNYINDNKINALGNPLPSENQPEIDFGTQEDFEFSFDLGIAPEVKIELSGKNKVPYYEIQVDDKMIDGAVKSYAGRFGKYEKVDAFCEDDMLKGELLELDADGKVLEDKGINVNDALLSPKFAMKDNPEAQKLFDGKKVGGTVVFNPQKAIGSQQELSSLLKISKDEVKTLTADFQFIIKEITRFTEAEINQELFDKTFGEGAVKSEKEFRKKIRENIALGYVQDADYKLSIDIHDLLMSNNDNLTFPETFLKRWLKTQKETLTDEAVADEYLKMTKDLTWRLIKNRVIKENEIDVHSDEIEAEARKIGRAQFVQYGIYNIEDEVIDSYVQDMLKKDDYVRQIVGRISEDKVIAAIRPQITLETKKISYEDFNKMFEK